MKTDEKKLHMNNQTLFQKGILKDCTFKKFLILYLRN